MEPGPPQPGRARACACRTDLRGQTFWCCCSLTPPTVPALVPFATDTGSQSSLVRSMLDTNTDLEPQTRLVPAGSWLGPTALPGPTSEPPPTPCQLPRGCRRTLGRGGGCRGKQAEFSSGPLVQNQQMRPAKGQRCPRALPWRRPLRSGKTRRS